MQLRKTRLQALISTLALYYLDCAEDLAVLERGMFVPELPTVYILTEGTPDRVAYIGQTGNLRNRMSRHELDRGKGKRHWDRVFYFVPGIESLQSRLKAETALIAAAAPPQNKALLIRVSNGQLSEIRYKRKGRRRAG